MVHKLYFCIFNESIDQNTQIIADQHINQDRVNQRVSIEFGLCKQIFSGFAFNILQIIIHSLIIIHISSTGRLFSIPERLTNL